MAQKWEKVEGFEGSLDQEKGKKVRRERKGKEGSKKGNRVEKEGSGESRKFEENSWKVIEWLRLDLVELGLFCYFPRVSWTHVSLTLAGVFSQDSTLVPLSLIIAIEYLRFPFSPN